MGIHCSQRERRAEEAERDVDERFKCAWMEKHVGEEFDGVVTGVTSFGLFVELVESRVSGLIHVSQLPNDYYKFDPIRHLLEGEKTNSHYRLGDRVRVQVLRASLEDRKIDFRLVASLAKEVKKPAAVKRSAAGAAGAAIGRAAQAIGRAFSRRKVVAEEPVAVDNHVPVARSPSRRQAPVESEPRSRGGRSGQGRGDRGQGDQGQRGQRSSSKNTTGGRGNAAKRAPAKTGKPGPKKKS